ncbi:hypothetical protein SLS55_006020 [Diplodia seriata]|uniref:Uncharacterized protein n=1 Tax=Diplodia seriata TaxID=420778 RepID=A0ABR3CD34_9PEZI
MPDTDAHSTSAPSTTSSSMPDRLRSLALGGGKKSPPATSEPYHPSIRAITTISPKAPLGETKYVTKGTPQVWGGVAWTRPQAHDPSLQEALVRTLVDGARGLPTHVLLVPDAQVVRVCAERHDIVMLLSTFEDGLEGGLDWHDFVTGVKAFLSDVDGKECEFRDLRHQMGGRLARLVGHTDHFDIWQRGMVRLDHLCQLVIVDCCDLVDVPPKPKPSLVRRLTQKLKA